MSEALYIRIAERLRKKILSGKLMPDDLLPSEKELALRYETSRVTVRKALDILEHEGFVKARQGKGYFVQPPRHSVFTLVFGDNDIGGVYQPPDVCVEVPSSEVAAALRLAEGQTVTALRRVLLRRGRAIAFDEKFILCDRELPAPAEGQDYSEFAGLLQDRFAAMSLQTELAILPERPSPRAAAALGVGTEEVLLAVNRRVLTAAGKPVAYGKQLLTGECGPIVARSGPFLFDRGD